MGRKTTVYARLFQVQFGHILKERNAARMRAVALDIVWTIELLGRLRAVGRQDNTTIARFRTRRTASLLAYLAYRQSSRAPTRGEIVEVLWPYSEGDRGLARLAVELSALRAQLEPPGVPRGSVLCADRFTIALGASVTSDVAQFQELRKRARAGGDVSERIDCLSQAVQRYGGRLLPGEDAEWVEPERERLVTEFLGAATEAVGLLLDRGDTASALGLAYRALECEPQREESHCLVLRCLVRVGNADEARRQFSALTRMLSDTVGDTPGPEAQRLAGEALQVLPAAPPAPPPRRNNGGDGLPSGLVALLATDIVGSTAIGREIGEAEFSRLLGLHHPLLRAEFARAGGVEFVDGGDGFWVAFSAVRDAVACACACQKALMSARSRPDWPTPIAVRMAIHVADLVPEPTGAEGASGYQGLALHDLARLAPAAHGGQILLSEAAEAVLRGHAPEGVHLLDRGRFRLRDSVAIQNLYEAAYEPGMETPLPNAPRARTPQLPAALTRFVGREDDLRRIAEAFLGGGTRLLTLTGIGGSGKTRLATEAARALSDRFEGAVWMVSLVGVSDGTRIAEAVRGIVAPEFAGDAWDGIGSAVNTQPSLIVLDNLEHLLNPDGEQCAEQFVRNALETFPTLSFLATSRQRIDLAAEREFPVRPLPVPKPGATAESLRAVESVVLFEDRARRAQFDFQVTDRNADAVASLCRQLEGIPLAVELAASWARVLTPAEMLEQFDDIRRSRGRDIPERHRSLEAALEGSFRLLPPDLRQFFATLSVFRGGWTLAAARSVCAEPGALGLLSDLRDHSLVLVDGGGTGSRYSFLETVREFAAARLAQSPEYLFGAQERQAEFFSKIAADANAALIGPEQGEWLTRLAADHLNLMAVLNRAAPATRIKMAVQLNRYWTIRGYLPEARALLADVLSEDIGDVAAVDLNKAINVAGVLALSAGDLVAAKSLFATSAARCSALGDEAAAGAATINLGIVASSQGEFAEARTIYESTLELWRRLDRKKILATVLSNLGVLAKEQGDLDAARRYLEESLQMQAVAADSLLRANTLQNLAFVTEAQHDLAAATWFVSESLKIRLELADDRGIAGLLPLIALLQWGAGQPERAALLYGATEAAVALTGTELMPMIRRAVEIKMAEITADIGRTARSAWDTGRAMPWHQIVAAALDANHI
jgi:predicted ATPase/DNA-binding SARP family transcriptional activator/class 3 adenylate cyclase